MTMTLQFFPITLLTMINTRISFFSFQSLTFYRKWGASFLILQFLCEFRNNSYITTRALYTFWIWLVDLQSLSYNKQHYMSGRETHGVLIKFSVILCVQNTVYDNRVLNIWRCCTNQYQFRKHRSQIRSKILIRVARLPNA